MLLYLIALRLVRRAHILQGLRIVLWNHTKILDVWRFVRVTTAFAGAGVPALIHHVATGFTLESGIMALVQILLLHMVH